MATCPKCGAHIPFYDLRPNCKVCNVNIMYYGLEERLAADAKKAEEDFAKFDKLILGVKRSVIGSSLTLARIIAGFLSIALLCLPIVTLSISLPYAEIPTSNYGIVQVVFVVLDMIEWIEFDGLFALMGSALALPTILFVACILMLALSAVFSLVAVIIYALPHPEKGFKRNVVLRSIAIGTFVLSFILFFVAQAWGNGAQANIISGGVSFGGFIYLAAQLALLYIEFHIKKHGIPDEPLKFGKKKKEAKKADSKKEKETVKA